MYSVRQILDLIGRLVGLIEDEFAMITFTSTAVFELAKLIGKMPTPTPPESSDKIDGLIRSLKKALS